MSCLGPLAAGHGRRHRAQPPVERLSPRRRALGPPRQLVHRAARGPPAGRAAPAERRASVPANLVRGAPVDAPTPASLGHMDVTLGENPASAVAKPSGEGTSPFNQLSPLHLSDILGSL